MREVGQQCLTEELRKKADETCARYEQKRAALLPVLWLIQEKFGCIPNESHEEIAEYFALPLSDLQEVLTFYSLYYSEPKGRFHFQVCRNLSCSIMGGEEILARLQEKLGIHPGETSADGKFSLSVVECLGACELAPMLQLNTRYVGCLTLTKMDELIRECAEGIRSGVIPSDTPSPFSSPPEGGEGRVRGKHSS